MKDIEEVRSGLRKIRFALEDNMPPHPPRFGGRVAKASRSDLYEFADDAGDETAERLVDVRDADSLFEELDNAVNSNGIEALAWYHPFHLSADQWGIYIPTTSVHYGAERWFNPRMRLSRRTSLAFATLVNHEVIHHACEYAVAQFELLLRVACWAPARTRLKNANSEWFNDEEALASFCREIHFAL